jgi:potassium-transporting ATPase KdpC subunit
MNNTIEREGLLREVGTSVRIVIITMGACCLLYPMVISGIGQTLAPHRANGSLVYNDHGEIAGSELIAQGFSRPGYFWPRPSAVGYNAAAAGGSNLSPANPELRARAKARVTRFGATSNDPIPADLVTASGSGLDPHITLEGARFQAERVASARGLSVGAVTELLVRHANRPGGALTPEPLVNVLIVNMELDRLGK